ncbi:MAG: CYTH domain-containing protein [bacterium]
MQIEFEATFPDISKNNAREMLKNADAKLIRPEYFQRRINFYVPDNIVPNSWLRVRDEGDKITMSLKRNDGPSIENQQEICMEVDNFATAVNFLESLGFKQKSYQETKRELWKLDKAEITIDEWPFLEPFMEVEADSEREIKEVCEKLGLDFSKALFCPITVLYSMKYNIPEEYINNEIPKIIFEEKNPFIKI